jgi:cytochrome c-type biogenesis protein CcmH/NrfF
VAVVAGGVILLGLVALAVYRRAAQAPSSDAAGQDSASLSPTEAAQQGTPIVAVAVNLSAEAAIVAERYRCVCSCNDPLSVCACTLTPGSIDMKKYVQELVDQKKSVGEIDAAMVARYGEAALLSNTPPPAGQTARSPRVAPASPPARPRKP